MTDKIVEIPVRFKQRPSGDKMLHVVNYDRKCQHNGTFLVDDSMEHVECSLCNERLSPMWVLIKLAREETKWHHARERYHDEMQRLSERQRTKCDHCGQMTRISRN